MRAKLFERFLKESPYYVVISWHYMERRSWTPIGPCHYYKVTYEYPSELDLPRCEQEVADTWARIFSGEALPTYEDMPPGIVTIDKVPMHLTGGDSLLQSFLRWRMESGV